MPLVLGSEHLEDGPRGRAMVQGRAGSDQLSDVPFIGFLPSLPPFAPSESAAVPRP